MSRKTVVHKTLFDRKKAEPLLLPIAAFLKGGGMSKTEAAEILMSVYERAAKALKGRKTQHIGNHVPYQDVIALLLTDKRFGDKIGKPRILSLDGKGGFAALIRPSRGSDKITPQVLLTVLLHYGNAHKVGKNKCALVESFFNTFGSKNIAFRPHAKSLSDATNTIGRMLLRKKRVTGVAPFLLRVENIDLPAAAARRFRVYTSPSSLEFLEDRDTWPDFYAIKNNGSRDKSQKRRIGLGLFPICSEQTEFQIKPSPQCRDFDQFSCPCSSTDF